MCGAPGPPGVRRLGASVHFLSLRSGRAHGEDALCGWPRTAHSSPLTSGLAASRGRLAQRHDRSAQLARCGRRLGEVEFLRRNVTFGHTASCWCIQRVALDPGAAANRFGVVLCRPSLGGRQIGRAGLPPLSTGRACSLLMRGADFSANDSAVWSFLPALAGSFGSGSRSVQLLKGGLVVSRAGPPAPSLSRLQ